MNHSAQAKFAIVCAARTGSTMLRLLLNSHPAIVCHGEVFSPEQIRGLEQANSDPQSLLSERQHDPVRFLEAHVFGVKGVKAAGFKIKYEELYAPAGQPLLAALRGNSAVKIVHLTRTNHLKRFASQRIAEQSAGVYGAYRGGPLPPQRKVALSAAACMENFRLIEALEGKTRTDFRAHAIFEVSYESLLESTVMLTRLQEFLGVPAAVLDTPSLKMNSDLLPELLLNWDELSAALQSTRYAALLS